MPQDPFSIVLEPSASFERVPPANVFSEDLHLFGPNYHYDSNNVFLKRFTNAWVTSDSVVYERGRLKPETLADQSQWRYYAVNHLAKHLLRSRRVALPRGSSYLLVTDQWSVGHYHWFAETIPRLWSIRGRSREFVLLLPDTGYIRKTAIESLELLGLEFADVILMSPQTLYKASELHFVTKIAEAGQVHNRLMSEINAAFLKGRATGHEKVYFSRERESFRRVLNEGSLIGVLRAHGFRIVYGPSRSLSEQVDLFARCDTLIGLHGAGLTNCLFMRPGGNVVELRKREPNYGYWHLADSVGHRYFYYHGKPDSEQSLIGRGCNLTIDVKDFEATLLRPLLDGEFTK